MPRFLIYLTLPAVELIRPAALVRGVSKVALGVERSRAGDGGFYKAYRRAGGDPDKLSDYWIQKRDAFIARHRAQMRERGSNGWEKVGGEWRPTRQHLALAAWAYSPSPDRLIRWAESQ
jgi:hypothetical protein